MSFLINPFAFAVAGGDFESIATVTVGSGGASEVVFDNIPQTYAAIQIRYICRSSYDPAGSLPAIQIEMKANAETGNAYSFHELRGDGSSASAAGYASQGFIYPGYHASADSSSNIYGAGIIDVIDYSSTSKTTTFRAFSGADNNGSGRVALYSSVWTSTAALTKLTIAATFSSGTISQHSQFALFGVKAP